MILLYIYCKISEAIQQLYIMSLKFKWVFLLKNTAIESLNQWVELENQISPICEQIIWSYFVNRINRINMNHTTLILKFNSVNWLDPTAVLEPTTWRRGRLLWIMTYLWINSFYNYIHCNFNNVSQTQTHNATFINVLLDVLWLNVDNHTGIQWSG